MCSSHAVSETPPAAEQPVLPPAPSKRSRKRIFAVVGVVAVAAVALSLVFAFLISPQAGATIPMSYNFTPGEEMTYNLTESVTTGLGQNTTLKETMIMHILSFDGGNYTINQTVTLSMSVGSPMTYSFTEKMNKTGYVTDLNGTSGIMQAYSMFGGMGTSWQKDEARVGETWQVPLSLGNSTYAQFTGNLSLTFGDIQNVTVPAGVYRAFRIDISGVNLSVVVNTPPPVNMSIFENFTMSGQMYLEYGTCRLVEYDLQASISILQGAQTTTSNISMHTELVKHTGH